VTLQAKGFPVAAVAEVLSLHCVAPVSLQKKVRVAEGAVWFQRTRKIIVMTLETIGFSAGKLFGVTGGRCLSVRPGTAEDDGTRYHQGADRCKGFHQFTPLPAPKS
jgi:hypothetical protein